MSHAKADLLAVFGTDEATPAAADLRIGRYRLRISGGQIASIHCDGTEICRGLTYLVRDRNWATLSTRTEVDGPRNDRAALRGAVSAGGIEFDYLIELSLDDGNLRVSSRGTARSDFSANRIGFSFLHPTPDCTNQPVVCHHTDGRRSDTRFPLAISPGQPLFDIAGLDYGLSDGRPLQIRFTASRPGKPVICFEMEDQRNWGDASYKTYVGSLLDPWPFDVARGDLFEQSILLSVGKGRPRPKGGARDRATATGRHFRLPALGLSVPEGQAAAALGSVRSLGHSKPAFLSAWLATGRLERPELAAVAALGHEIGVPLRIELEVNGAPRDALASAADALARAGVVPSEVIACQDVHLRSYQPTGPWPDAMPLDAFYRALRDVFPKAKIGGGALTYFPELNRLPPPSEPLDFVGFGYCPIVHASDETTILQNVRTLHDMEATMDKRFPDKPWHVLSAALSMRRNPYGDRPEPNPDRRRIAMSAADPREAAEFGAYWMLALLHAAASTRAGSICLGALAGPSSIFGSDSALPTHRLLCEIAGLESTDRDGFLALSGQLGRELLRKTVHAFGPPGNWNISP